MTQSHQASIEAQGATALDAPHSSEAAFALIEAVIEAYDDLRHRCYEAARRDNGALMGDDAWLRFALDERDLQLRPTRDGIECWGSTYTTQTMSNEGFDFHVPLRALTESPTPAKAPRSSASGRAPVAP